MDKTVMTKKEVRNRQGETPGEILDIIERQATKTDRLSKINQALLAMKESIPGGEFFTDALPSDIKDVVLKLEAERDAIISAQQK